jgi:hypothetical protein
MIRQEKIIKVIQKEDWRVKLFLLADDMVLCLKDPKDSNKSLLRLVNTFRKIAGYNIRKSVALKYWWKELKKTLEDGKTSHVHELAKLILWKWLYIKSDLQIQYSQNSNDILYRNIYKILTFIWKGKRFWMSKAILIKENNARSITIPKGNYMTEP